MASERVDSEYDVTEALAAAPPPPPPRLRALPLPLLLRLALRRDAARRTRRLPCPPCLRRHLRFVSDPQRAPVAGLRLRVRLRRARAGASFRSAERRFGSAKSPSSVVIPRNPKPSAAHTWRSADPLTRLRGRLRHRARHVADASASASSASTLRGAGPTRAPREAGSVSSQCARRSKTRAGIDERRRRILGDPSAGLRACAARRGERGEALHYRTDAVANLPTPVRTRARRFLVNPPRPRGKARRRASSFYDHPATTAAVARGGPSSPSRRRRRTPSDARALAPLSRGRRRAATSLARFAAPLEHCARRRRQRRRRRRRGVAESQTRRWRRSERRRARRARSVSSAHRPPGSRARARGLRAAFKAADAPFRCPRAWLRRTGRTRPRVANATPRAEHLERGRRRVAVDPLAQPRKSAARCPWPPRA